MAGPSTSTKRRNGKVRRGQAPQCLHVDPATSTQCGHSTWDPDGICSRHTDSTPMASVASITDIDNLSNADIPPDATVVPDELPQRTRTKGAKLDGSLTKSSKKATEHQASLEKAIRNLHDDEELQHWEDYLKFSVWVRNHSASRYGSGNRMLIFLALSQKPDATFFILPRKAWEKKGREVDTDEGIPIWVPVRQKYSVKDSDGYDEIDAETGQPVQRSSLRFYLGGYKGNARVWDMADTSGDPLEMPHNPMDSRATGSVEAVEALSEALQTVAEDLGVGIDYQQIPGTSSGYFSRQRKQIMIDTNQDDATQVASLAHELAHAADPFLAKKPWKYQACRDECEYVAESVAYMLCHTFGIDTEKASARYLKNWAPERVRQAKEIGDRVDKIYNTVLDSIDKHAPELQNFCKSAETEELDTQREAA